ncbi:tudor domain-containing protein 1 isoform X2 [Alosa sapidissima]|uniref:tudor domain-containing protein 1 isoform X2 n=1 Tax=Alosa sapidissima TaxID=34773 RepID=UPI001C087A51|nr:tudor domain-containing protein 1 isoform X2 [Alosa sapidissima]
MNRAFISPMVRPNLPLRRPATNPGVVSPSCSSPVVAEQISYQAPEQPTPEVKGPINRQSSRPVCAMDLSSTMLAVPGSATVKLCNYCGQEGQLRCSGCKKTNYCSVSCQSEDWPAHRHVCKTTAAEVDQSEKPKESPAMSATTVATVAEPKVNGTDAPQTKRVYVQDLSKNDIPKGTEIKALVVDVQSPSKFFIHIHSATVEESLRKISMELQKTCGGSSASPYSPDVAEICAIKFSQDQHWYRGLVQTVSGDQQNARVLYIDFGNEEDVPFDRIRPLPDSIDRTAPNALQCRVAGVAAAAGGWKEECNIFLRQLLYGKSAAIHVLSVTGDAQRLYSVDMKVASTDKMLSSFLLEQGYAVKISPTTEQEIDSMLNASVEKYLCQVDAPSNSAEAQHPVLQFQEVGDSFTGVVTYLLSPADIVCQVVQNSRVIQELQVKLKEHCSRLQPSDSFKPSLGTICCALFSEDKEWYRAKVLNYTSETRASVSLIDYGNVEEVELTHLLPISAELLALAAQGIPCSLAGILAPEGSWPEQAALILKRLVSNRFLRVEVRGRQADRIQVAMVDESSDPQTDMSELLVSMGYALAEPKAAPAEALQLQTTPQPKTGAGPGAIPKTPVMNAPKAPKLEWSCSELPCDGQLAVMVASVIDNPGEFYCYRYIPEDLQALAQLSAELLKHCEGDAAPLSPVVGEPCCALFSDGSWYRAMVQSVGADGKVQVYFVDYGNSCTVEATHLRTMEQRLLTLPFLAIRCWLAGVEPVGGQWAQAAIQRMQELCAGQYLTGRVVSITERGYGIELQSDSHNIAATLLSEQLAKQPNVNQTSCPCPPNSANQSQPPAPHTPVAANQSQAPAPSAVSSSNQSQGPATCPPSQSQVVTNATSQPQASVSHPPVATNQSQAPGARPSGTTSQSQAPSTHPSAATNHREAPAVAPPLKTPIVDQSPASPPTATFPLDWKTEELPRNQAFTPRVAAAISPALFFIMSSTEVTSDKFQSLIMEVEKYCGQASPSQTKPQPGAACCAQFSGDKKWYRAVVLDINSSKASVIYADFGNAEEVPLSHILPIPREFLQIPLRIVRCTLTGKERFPSVWPEGSMELFGTLLSGKLQATAQAFDGTVNLLDITHQAKGPISPLLLKSLQGPQAAASAPQAPESKVLPQPPPPPPQPISTPQPGAPAKAPVESPAPAKPQDSAPKQQASPVTGGPKKVPEAKEVPGSTGSVPNDVAHKACCCSELKNKMEKLEDLIVHLMQQINGWQNSVVH